MLSSVVGVVVFGAMVSLFEAMELCVSLHMILFRSADATIQGRLCDRCDYLEELLATAVTISGYEYVMRC